MRDTSPPLTSNPAIAPAAEPTSKRSSFRRWFRWLQFLVPAALVVLVAVYEIGPAHWLHDRLGEEAHFVAEILVYGSVGPVLAFLLLHLLGRWIEEKETSDLQARVLAQAYEHVRISHKLSDDALQALFAASMLLASLKSSLPDPLPETASNLLAVQRSLDSAIRRLRDHLQTWPPSKA